MPRKEDAPTREAGDPIDALDESNPVNTGTDIPGEDQQRDEPKRQIDGTETDGGAGEASFVKATGIKKDQLLAYNKDSATGVTTDGGKYRVDDDGNVVHMSGPVPPSQQGEVDKQAEERREARENA